MPEFDTLSEIILYVRDMDRVASFYQDVLGLEIDGGDPSHGFVRFDTGTCSLCLHAGGESDSGSNSPSFVFEVADLEDACAHLREHDVELGDVRTPAPDVRVCDGLDPEGNTFSIESRTGPE